MPLLYPRWQYHNLEKALKTRRVLMVTGSRQCGKSTLVKLLAGNDVEYRSLDDPVLLESARTDFKAFLKHSSKHLIVDEIQKEPGLIPVIKLFVDEDTRPGQFILTGSANLQSLPSVTESLAGRIRRLRLRPLTQGEIFQSKPGFLQNAFEASFAIRDEQWDRDAVLDSAFRGGFPEVVQMDPEDRADWQEDYLESLLERDLQVISNIKHRSEMKKLVQVLAAWSGKFMDLSAIGSHLELSRPTLTSYINMLESVYLIDRVSPWVKSDYARVGKQDKLYMTDTGFMAAVLNWRADQVRLDSDRLGKLVETFVYNELIAQVDINRRDYSLFHYRDRDKREIDFLVERHDEAVLGIEVKAGSNVTPNHFTHMRWFKEKHRNLKSFTGIVLYTGEHVASFGEGFWAVPISALWPQQAVSEVL